MMWSDRIKDFLIQDPPTEFFFTEPGGDSLFGICIDADWTTMSRGVPEVIIDDNLY